MSRVSQDNEQETVTQEFDEIEKLAELAIGAADIKKYVPLSIEY